MAVSLKKNGKVKHPKQNRDLEFVAVKLSWPARSTFGNEFDLDLSCFLLNAAGVVTGEKDFVFYNNPVSDCGSVIYLHDNRKGESFDEDNETVYIDLPKLPAQIVRLVLGVTIHEAEERNQFFGMVSDAEISIINRKNKKTLATYVLDEAFPDDSAIIICEFYRHENGWKLRTLERQNAADLAAIAQNFGVCTE